MRLNEITAYDARIYAGARAQVRRGQADRWRGGYLFCHIQMITCSTKLRLCPIRSYLLQSSTKTSRRATNISRATPHACSTRTWFVWTSGGFGEASCPTWPTSCPYSHAQYHSLTIFHQCNPPLLLSYNNQLTVHSVAKLGETPLIIKGKGIRLTGARRKRLLCPCLCLRVCLLHAHNLRTAPTRFDIRCGIDHRAGRGWRAHFAGDLDVRRGFHGQRHQVGFTLGYLPDYGSSQRKPSADCCQCKRGLCILHRLIVSGGMCTGALVLHCELVADCVPTDGHGGCDHAAHTASRCALLQPRPNRGGTRCPAQR